MTKRLSGILLLLTFPIFITLQAQEYGLAGSYSDEFDGGKTAYDEIYDKDKMTCAHKKHGLGTMLRVTRLDNKKSVVVRVNDKGPYIKGRVVDVSKAAARQLGLLKDGVAEVKIEVVSRSSNDDKETATVAPPKIPERRPAPAEDTSPRITIDEPSTTTSDNSRISKSNDDPVTTTPKTTVRTKSSTDNSKSSSTSSGTIRSRLVTNDYTPYGLYKIRLERPVQVGFGVQIVSLSNYENVLRQVADLQAKGFDDVLVSVEPDFDGTSVYKIILGSFQTMAQAKSYQSSLKKRYKLDGFVVDLNETNY